MQVRDVMTREVCSVGPETPVTYAAEVMATRGFAALPVIDDQDRMLGIVTEADVLPRLVQGDPRLSPEVEPARDPTLLVERVMSRDVHCVPATADLSEVARLILDEQLRSVPVVEEGRLTGIVSRRDLLRALVRSDEAVRADVLDLAERYTGSPGRWDVDVSEGVVSVRRTGDQPVIDTDADDRAVRALAASVGGVVAVRVLTGWRQQ